MKQRTILREVSITGKALHTGSEVTLTFKPAAVDHGIVFKRTDLYGKPGVKPAVANLGDLVRNTTLSQGHAQIHTVEHVLAALHGMGVDNVIVELDASEPPIMDGSAKHFVNLLQEAEPVEQDKERVYYTLQEPVCVTSGHRSIIAVPYDGLKITCTSADDRGVHTQHLSLEINPEVFAAQIAPARTFTIYEDIEELLKMGKIQGGSLDSAIVIKGDKIISKEPLRFKDEFVRHKILDIIGDITLLGMPLKAHIIAVRPGHALNAEFTKSVFDQQQKHKGSKSKKKEGSVAISPDETSIDIRRILEILPHRYPFLLVDRVTNIDLEKREIVAIKNVTINEPFFQGHFPGHPVMPGVLQIEAMAQAAGAVLLAQVDFKDRIALFMSCDKVKFRKAVVPGDQLVMHVKLDKIRGGRIATAQAECKVDGKVVSSADLMFTIVDPSNES